MTNELSDDQSTIKIVLLQHIDIYKPEYKATIIHTFQKIGYNCIVHAELKGKGVAIAYNKKWFKSHKILYKDKGFKILSIMVKSGSANISISSIYGIPNQIINENKQFAEKVKHLSITIKQEFDKLNEQPLIIIGGDTNTIWCHNDYSSLTNEEISRPTDYLFNDVIMEWQLIDAYLNQAELPIPRFTFSTNTSCSRLDKIYINENIITKPNKTIHSTFGTLQTDHLTV